MSNVIDLAEWLEHHPRRGSDLVVTGQPSQPTGPSTIAEVLEIARAEIARRDRPTRAS